MITAIVVVALASGGLRDAYAQLSVSSQGSSKGAFSTLPQSDTAGSAALSLNLTSAMDDNASPGSIYAVRKTLSGAEFAYCLVVLHAPPHEPDIEHPYHVNVQDRVGTIELSVTFGKRICKVSYLFEAPNER